MKEVYLERAQLSRPQVDEGRAADLLRTHYSLSGSIVELGSQQDRNYRIETEIGRFVLKISRAEYAVAELAAQNAALAHVAAKDSALRVPALVHAVDGQAMPVVTLDGDVLTLRLLTYLDGEPLTRRLYLSPQTVGALGTLSGRLAVALSDFTHPGLMRDLQWDLRRAATVTRHLLPAISDKALKRRIGHAAEEADQRLEPLKTQLRLQAVHQDVTDDNVVSRLDAAARPIPDGVIDFGDLHRGWLAADLAVTCAALLHHADGDPFFILPAIRAFHAVCPLTHSELKALWPLVVARAAVLVASSAQQMALDPDNVYVAGNIGHERAIFDVATTVPFTLMETAILQSVGFEDEGRRFPIHSLLCPQIDAAAVAILPLDIHNPLFDGAGQPDLALEHGLIAEARKGSPCVATRYGEHRLTRTLALSAKAPETCALHVDLFLAPETIVTAPFAGRLQIAKDRVILRGSDISLHLSGLVPLARSTTVAAGDPIGEIAPGGLLRVQLCTQAGIVPPLFAAPAQAQAWKALCPSPKTLLGFNCDAPEADSDDLLARRERHFARPQKHYYSEPPQMERGFREYMVDVRGRAYLDMVNNVALLGHGHAGLAQAVNRQWLRLNTNSRFHYASVAAFCERLAGLAPEGLDTVFLVNSGSEAVDLALRLAWAATGARNIVCLLEAYHGWSVASDAVSTSIADNPRALMTRPPWVHPVMAPNTYRGPFRGHNSTAGYVSQVDSALSEIDAAGEGLAGFICEAVYGNAGGIALPPGYLRAVYEKVRARGGICIADEVQVGYGRLGHHFWGFEEQQVAPDIITIAKGMGNGHPLGAVITSSKIAGALEREGYFFSSAGGSPVSCVVGMTVLDALRDEGLQENARIVGDHLKARLEALVQRFPLCGAVHGMGLYLGLEFVRDRRTLEPATQETAAICDRLLELGVLMQPTGDHLNVLKIKPPLCLSRQSADFFCDMLERVLEDGW